MNRIMMAGFWIFLFGFTIFSYLFIDPNFFPLKKLYTGFSTTNRLEATLIYTLFIFIFYGFYFFILNRVRKNLLTISSIKRYVLGGAVVLFFAYPAILSYDIFNYMLTAKVLYFYGENPYIVMPIEFLSDPNLVFTRAANKISLYGPSWLVLSAVPWFLGFHNILATLFAFKLLVFSFYLATTWLIWKISKNIYSVCLFAFNPLILVEILASSHNDIVMMFFALLAFYLLKQKKLFISAVLLLISILVKYATVFLLPVFIYTVFISLRKKTIPWERVYTLATLFLFIAFLTAPIREEFYPWYVTWMLSFAVLVPKQTFLLAFILTLSIGSLFRYLPVLYTGSYFGITPTVKEVVTFLPILVLSIFWLCKKIFWQKYFR